MQRDDTHDTIRELTQDLVGGHLTRGAFVTKALAMGLSAVAAQHLLDATPAFAMGPTERELRSASSKTYQYWTPFGGTDGPRMKAMVDQYNAAHPGTYFNLSRIGGGYENKMTAAAIAHVLPDVAIYRVDNVADVIARGIVDTVDDIVRANGIKASDYTPSVWAGGTVNGRQYTIPLDQNLACLYYNRDILHRAGIAEAPTNRAEFDATVAAVKKLGGGVQAFPVSLTWPSVYNFITFLYQLGGSLWTSGAQPRAAFNSPEGEEALRFLVNLIKTGASAPNIQDDGNVAFYNNKAALWMDGTWFLNGLQSTRVNFSAGPAPYLFKHKVAISGSHQLVLPTKPRSSTERAAMGHFMAWISTHSIEWAKTGAIPANRTVRESAAYQAMHPQADIAQQVPYLKPVFTFPGAAAAYFGSAFTYSTQIMQGKMGVKEGLGKMATATDKQLAAVRASLNQGPGGD